MPFRALRKNCDHLEVEFKLYVDKELIPGRLYVPLHNLVYKTKGGVAKEFNPEAEKSSGESKSQLSGSGRNFRSHHAKPVRLVGSAVFGCL